MSSRIRSGSGSNRPKEKVVYIYEMLLRPDFEDPIKSNSEFWNEFFLLQPNVETLESELTKLSFDQLIALKRNINLLFSQSIELLDSGRCCVHFHFLIVFHLRLKLSSLFVVGHLQTIRSECATRCKHFVHFSTRFLNVMRPMQPAWISSGPFSILRRRKRK